MQSFLPRLRSLFRCPSPSSLVLLLWSGLSTSHFVVCGPELGFFGLGCPSSMLLLARPQVQDAPLGHAGVTTPVAVASTLVLCLDCTECCTS